VTYYDEIQMMIINKFIYEY